jgi:hypothetical protein
MPRNIFLEVEHSRTTSDCTSTGLQRNFVVVSMKCRFSSFISLLDSTLKEWLYTLNLVTKIKFGMS